MIRVIVPLLVMLACFGGGVVFGRATTPNLQVRKIKEHASLLKQSRRASLRDQHGLANIYAEAAERVLEIPDDVE